MMFKICFGILAIILAAASVGIWSVPSSIVGVLWALVAIAVLAGI